MSKAYKNRTKDELVEEARRRDLSTSGTKQELVDRLSDADRDGSSDGSSDGEAAGGRRDSARPTALRTARRAADQLGELTGKRVDGVSGFAQADEGGWRVLLEVVEVARIPPSTDVLGSYEVITDDDGDVVSYKRVSRYVRGAAREE